MHKFPKAKICSKQQLHSAIDCLSFVIVCLVSLPPEIVRNMSDFSDLSFGYIADKVASVCEQDHSNLTFCFSSFYVSK